MRREEGEEEEEEEKGGDEEEEEKAVVRVNAYVGRQRRRPLCWPVSDFPRHQQDQSFPLISLNSPR